MSDYFNDSRFGEIARSLLSRNRRTRVRDRNEAIALNIILSSIDRAKIEQQENLAKSITDIKTGLVEIKNDKDGNLALSIGRKNFSKEKLQENYKYFIDFLKKEKPENIKGEFIKNIFLTSTMGISYKLGGKN